MFLNDRRLLMLTQLINHNEAMSISEIAHRFNVSERTVRYDLDAIDEYLFESKAPKLIRKRNGQVLAASDQGKYEVSLLNKGLYECVLSANQRKYMILNELLCEKSYITINELADKMFFSRNTIIKDLAAVKEWLARNKLQINSAPKYGIKVEGEEKYIRKATLRLLREAFSFEQYVELAYNKFALINKNIYPFIFYRRIFNDIDMDELCRYIKTLETELNVIFTDISFVDLVLCLALVIQRVRTGRNVSLNKEDTASFLHTQTFAILAAGISNLQRSLNMIFSSDELIFFTQYVLGSNVTSSNHNEERANRMESHVLISNLIANVSRDLKKDLSSNKQLFDCLYQEIVPAIHRIKHGLSIPNPYLKDIKSNYGSLFRIIQKNLKTIEEYTGSPLSEDEIGYISLHFGAVLEKLQNSKPVPKLLVVCGTGRGTANLLAAKIEAQFNVEIIATSALHDAGNLLKCHDIDVIVSTIPSTLGTIPSICVSPMLGPGDISTLRKFFTDWQEGFRKDNAGAHTHEMAQHKAAMSYTKGLEQTPGLLAVLHGNLIRIDITAANWQEAIEIAGLVLYEQGYIEYSYIHSMIDMVKRHGPYIVFWKGVALPHSNATADVKRLGISFIKLKTPVVFGNAEHDPVDMVFALATPNEQCHIKALMELSNLLSNYTLVERLRSAAAVDEIQSIIQSFVGAPPNN